MQEIIIALIGIVGAVLGAAAGAYLTYKFTQRQQQQRMSDRQIFEAWRIAFDRPAFKGPWTWHSNIGAFRRAIEATIKAVDTGDIRGSEERGKGRAYLSNREWLLKMDEVERRLNRIRSLVYQIENPETKPSHEQEKPLTDVSAMIDHERDEVIETLNSIWKVLKIPTLRKPTEVKTYDEILD